MAERRKEHGDQAHHDRSHSQFRVGMLIGAFSNNFEGRQLSKQEKESGYAGIQSDDYPVPAHARTSPLQKLKVASCCFLLLGDLGSQFSCLLGES